MLNKSDWVKEFVLDLKQMRYSSYTQEQYQWHVEKFIEWVDKHEPNIRTFAQVTRQTLRHWGAAMTEKWSPATHRQGVSALKSFFKFLRLEGIIEIDPAADIPLPKVPKRKQRTVSAEEIKAMLRTAEKLCTPFRERDLALVSLLADSGLRVMEVCDVVIKNLFLEERLIWLLGKGDKEGIVHFGKKTEKYLVSWLQVRENWLRNKGYGDPSTIFISIGGITPGCALTREGIQSILSRLSEDAGIPSVSPHAFRRAFASQLSKNGAPSRIVQLVGRWKSLRMVQRYTRSLEAAEEIKELYEPYSPIDNL